VLARILLRWAIIGVAFVVAVDLLTNIEVTGGFWSYVWVAALFGLVNTFIGSFLRFLTFPITILTLGISTLFVNTAMLALTASLSPDLTIHGFWAAFWAALIITIVSMVLDRALRGPRAKQRR
jgi:putative membrane protein